MARGLISNVAADTAATRATDETAPSSAAASMRRVTTRRLEGSGVMVALSHVGIDGVRSSLSRADITTVVVFRPGISLIDGPVAGTVVGVLMKVARPLVAADEGEAVSDVGNGLVVTASGPFRDDVVFTCWDSPETVDAEVAVTVGGVARRRLAVIVRDAVRGPGNTTSRSRFSSGVTSTGNHGRGAGGSAQHVVIIDVSVDVTFIPTNRPARTQLDEGSVLKEVPLTQM